MLVCVKEREASARLFKGKEGQQLAREIGKRVKTFVPGAPVIQRAGAAAAATGQAAASAAASAKQNIDAIKVCLLFAKRCWCCSGYDEQESPANAKGTRDSSACMKAHCEHM